MPLRYTANQALAARATTAQPHHLGIGGSLIDEDQTGGIKHALFSHPAPARPRHARALLLRCAQAFFESNLVTLKEAPDRGAAARNLVLAHRQNHFVQRQVRLLLTARLPKALDPDNCG